jgi:hypothetical protein
LEKIQLGLQTVQFRMTVTLICAQQLVSLAHHPGFLFGDLLPDLARLEA